MLPGLAMLLRLADALGCNVTDLVTVFDDVSGERRKREEK